MLVRLLVSGLVVGMVYGLIGLGYSTVYKASGLMNFVQGDMLTLGAFLGYTYYAVLGLPYIPALICTIITVFLFGIVLEKTVIRKILNKNIAAVYVVLATIALSYVVQNGSRMIWGAYMLTMPSAFETSKITLFGIKFQTEMIVTIGVSLVVMLALHLFMSKSKFGTAMRAAAIDPMAAKACGINVSLTTGVTWGIAASVAALGGMLVSPIYGVYLALGTKLGDKAFAGAVLGGYGNMYGAMVGGVLLGLAETFISGFIASQFKNLIVYVLLLVLLFVKPTGIFNERAIQD